MNFVKLFNCTDFIHSLRLSNLLFKKLSLHPPSLRSSPSLMKTGRSLLT